MLPTYQKSFASCSRGLLRLARIMNGGVAPTAAANKNLKRLYGSVLQCTWDRQTFGEGTKEAALKIANILEETENLSATRRW